MNTNYSSNGRKVVHRRFAALLTVLFMTILLSAAAWATPVDLTQFSEEGPGGGVWTLQNGNTSVFQSVNSSTPTFFISDNPFINNKFTGTLKVEEAGGDNDFIGFVFGYKQPFSGNGDAATDFDFILFDWKQGDQGAATRGFHLSRVVGDFSTPNDPQIDHGNTGATNPFWSHVDDVDANSSFTNLGTRTGGSNGWLDNTEYTFELTYQTNNVKIAINGGQFVNETIFDVAGSFAAGSFGFYNFSQANVRYAGFTEEEAPPTIPEPTTMILFGAGLLGLARVSRRKK